MQPSMPFDLLALLCACICNEIAPSLFFFFIFFFSLLSDFFVLVVFFVFSGTVFLPDISIAYPSSSS